MMRRGGMQQVELLDGAADDEPAPEPARTHGRWRWWAGGAAAVAVLALAGTQWVVDVREDAAVARLAAVPGVVPPLGDSLRVVRSISEQESTALWGSIDTGPATASLVVGPDGSQAFTAVDKVSGETAWSTPLLGPDAERAEPSSSTWGGACLAGAPDGQASTFAACLVTDGYLRIDDEGQQHVVAATTTRVTVLDTSDGHVLVEWPVEPDSQIAMLAGRLLVGHRDADAIEVVAQDPLTGDEQWRYQEPLVADPAAESDAMTEHFWTFFAAGDVLAFGNGGALALLSPTGEKVRDDLRAGDGNGGFGTDPVTGNLVMTVYGSSGEPETTTLLATDGDPASDRELDGRLLVTTVDDGSLPGLVLTALGQLDAWDRETGRERWTADVEPGYSALVVRGRIYLSTATSLVALDGRTGEVVWQTPASLGLGGFLATDGRQVLVPSTSSSGIADGGRLVAYDFATGQEVRRIPYPEGVTDVQMYNGLLLGWSSATEEVFVLE